MSLTACLWTLLQQCNMSCAGTIYFNIVSVSSHSTTPSTGWSSPAACWGSSWHFAWLTSCSIHCPHGTHGYGHSHIPAWGVGRGRESWALRKRWLDLHRPVYQTPPFEGHQQEVSCHWLSMAHSYQSLQVLLHEGTGTPGSPVCRLCPRRGRNCNGCAHSAELMCTHNQQTNLQGISFKCNCYFTIMGFPCNTINDVVLAAGAVCW